MFLVKSMYVFVEKHVCFFWKVKGFSEKHSLGELLKN